MVGEKRLLTIVTGTAPNSFGEAVVIALAQKHPSTSIVGIDLRQNPVLQTVPSFSEISINLNPLRSEDECDSLGRQCKTRLSTALDQFGCTGIGCLIQSAATYASSKFVEHDIVTMRSLLGLNVLGRFELLHAVLAINAERGVDSALDLEYVDVGSTHGLVASAGRPIYSATKAIGLDLCASLYANREISRCMYFAPGPIDTRMLHYNHWVVKAKGRRAQFEVAESHNEYRSAFCDCNEDAFGRIFSNGREDREEVLDTFARYKHYRRAAFAGPEGVVTAQVCANALVSVISTADSHRSGVLSLTSPNGQISIKHATFEEMRRDVHFNNVAKSLSSNHSQ